MTEAVHVVTSALSEIERARLVKAEQIISRGLTSFVEVGAELAAVRDQRLYRAEFGTFEEYAERKWNLSRPRAYELINGSVLTSAMSAIADTPVPKNEGQARVLSGLAPEQAADVMRKAHADTEGKVTAKAIQQAREMAVLAGTIPAPKKRTPKPTPEPANPMPTKADGRRQGAYGVKKKHLPVLNNITTSLDGLVMAAAEITALDASVTSEEAARIADDLSRQIKALADLNRLLKERTK